MKVRTSASVASVVPSLNTIVRVSRADQPLPEATVSNVAEDSNAADLAKANWRPLAS